MGVQPGAEDADPEHDAPVISAATTASRPIHSCHQTIIAGVSLTAVITAPNAPPAASWPCIVQRQARINPSSSIAFRLPTPIS